MRGQSRHAVARYRRGAGCVPRGGRTACPAKPLRRRMAPGRRINKANIQYPTRNIQRPSATAHKSRIQANIQYPNPRKKDSRTESRISQTAGAWGLLPSLNRYRYRYRYRNRHRALRCCRRNPSLPSPFDPDPDSDFDSDFPLSQLKTQNFSPISYPLYPSPLALVLAYLPEPYPLYPIPSLLSPISYPLVFECSYCLAFAPEMKDIIRFLFCNSSCPRSRAEKTRGKEDGRGTSKSD